MTIYVILALLSIIIGIVISVTVFGTGGKRAKIFNDIYFSVENVDGIGVLYTKTGEFSAILKISNPVQKYCADIDSYYAFSNLMSSVMGMLGEGYAIHKQDVLVRKRYDSHERSEGLQDTYFRYFKNREYTECTTYLTITQENKKNNLFSFDQKKWHGFLIKVVKVKDLLKDRGVSASFLKASEVKLFADQYLSQNYTDSYPSLNNLKSGDEQIVMGGKKMKIYSVVDVDCIGLPAIVRPYANMEFNNISMPVDLMALIDSIPGTSSVVFNQVIFLPNQKQEMSKLQKKRNRHSSLPSPSNQIAVEDIKRVEDLVTRENKQLVYCHFNLVVTVDKHFDLQKCTNYLENALGRNGIQISQRASNQLELFVASFPGNCYALNPDYDRFLTLSDAASCLMYKERMQKSEESPLKIYYTDRQGVPVAIDITGKEGKVKFTDNSNFFCLGPSGSGKSFHMNSVVRQLWEQNTDVVLVDTGNSYEGLCEFVGGKYISYTEEHPITMNPFAIKREEFNIEKIGFLKNLIMLIWKGMNGTVTKTEDRLIEQVINDYYDEYFNKKSIQQLSFNTFYEYSCPRIRAICNENHLQGVDLENYDYLLKIFYKGGTYETTLNEDLDSTLFDETFIVFEVDSIKGNELLFPLVILIIMDVFIQKMRIKKNRKVLVIEEAWKAIASPMMAEYIKYLYKTARKFWASVGVVTQELNDIIDSPIVKEAIINNSDVVMLLDQGKFIERFDDIKRILGLTEVECRKIFTINRLDNTTNRSFFREVFIRRGLTSDVYGVEESRECYMTYTTERAEKEALKLYKAELGLPIKDVLVAYCRDWTLSGIDSPYAFAQKVNKHGHVLNLKKS